MTVNLIGRHAQYGRAFGVMAFLSLPTPRSDDQIGALRLGLPQAVSEIFSRDPSGIQIVTRLVRSGHATSGGVVERW